MLFDPQYHLWQQEEFLMNQWIERIQQFMPSARIGKIQGQVIDIENKDIVLIDDVLYTGRTIRSGLDALLAFGRPAKVELLTMIDRRFRRDLPIQADYVGKTVDTLVSERVSVEWKEIEGEDKVILFTQENNG